MTTTMMDQHRPDITNTKLCIISVNISGLFDKKRRQNLFQLLESKKANIILLQETHSEKEVEKNGKKNGKENHFGIREILNPKPLE